MQAQDCYSEGRIQDEPFVSIVIPAFNAEPTIDRAVLSVMSQQGAVFELIIVDDGSFDGTWDIVRDMAQDDSRIEVVSQQNRGTASALNTGIERAKGRFVAALGADDELAPEYLETMSDFVIEYPGYDMYSHDCWMISRNGETSRFIGWDSVRSVGIEDILQDCVILGGGTLISRGLVTKLDGYREGLYNEDYDFFLRALAEGAGHLYCPRPLYLYHLSSHDRKTEQRREMYVSATQMLMDFIDRYPLTGKQMKLAEVTLAKFRKYVAEIDEFGEPSTQLTQEWATDSRAKLTRVLATFLPGKSVERVLDSLSGNALLQAVRQQWWNTRLFCLRCVQRIRGSRGR